MRWDIKEKDKRIMEINGWEIAGRVLKTAHDVGSFVMERLTVGGWGSTADAIQPPHVNVEHNLGEE